MNGYEPHNGRPSGPLAFAMKIVMVSVVALAVIVALRWAYLQWASAETRSNVDAVVARAQAWTQAQLAATQAKGRQLANHGIFGVDRKQREKEDREAEARRQRELAVAREAAWEKFYKPSPECVHPYSDAQFVECGNQYHRAKVKFEEVWQSRAK